MERDKSGLAAPVVEERRGSGSIGEAKEGGAKDPATGGKLEFVVKTWELGGGGSSPLQNHNLCIFVDYLESLQNSGYMCTLFFYNIYMCTQT